MLKPFHLLFQNKNFNINFQNIMNNSKYQQYLHCFIVCILFPYAFWFSYQYNIVTNLWQRILRCDTYKMGDAYQREALIWVHKRAVLIIGQPLFEARCLLEKIWYSGIVAGISYISFVLKDSKKKLDLPTFFISPFGHPLLPLALP